MIGSYRDIPLFKYLTDAECHLLKEKAMIVSKKQGEALALHGEPVAGINIVLSGEVGVYPPGAKRSFSTLGAGMAFGEMSFLDNSKASATIRVDNPVTEIALIPHQTLQMLIKSNPQLGANLFRGIAESVAHKLRSTNEKISKEVAATHRKLLDAKIGKPTDGASLIEKLNSRTSQQMSALSQKLSSMSQIATKLTQAVPEKATELNALGNELDSLTKTIRAALDDFNAQMSDLHQFVSVIERTLHH